MSVYRRGAIYWWCRTVALGGSRVGPIKLRISLKTSDKAEAKRRASLLEVELDMVAVRFPMREAGVTPSQLQAIHKEALEYKRDQIAHIQSNPPFDDDAHRRYNTAYSRIFGAIAHTGLTPDDPATLAIALNDEGLDQADRELIEQLAVVHGSPKKELYASLSYPATGENAFLRASYEERLSRPAIAPRLVTHYLENAGISNTAAHQKTALAVAATAYGQACIEANQQLGGTDAHGEFVMPVSLRAQIELKPYQDLPKHTAETEIDRVEGKTVIAATEVAINDNAYPPPQSVVGLPMAPASSQAHPQAASAHPGSIDLHISEVCNRAIKEYSRTNTWEDSSRRNARVITDIFIAEHGDLRMSEIKRSHLLSIDVRLKIMPVFWGKSSEDKSGGLPHVFRRGEALAAAWAADEDKAEREGIARVGLSSGTYNRHMNNLKQILGFVDVIAEIDPEQTYRRATVSFARLHMPDDRPKNKRKPEPFQAELLTLLSGPIFTGCQGFTARLTSGCFVFQDGGYWVLLLLAIYGARSNEFCQMPLVNVHVDAPIPFFRIRNSSHQRTKTLASNRDLPIALKLIALGFVDYIMALRARNERWLFPEFNTTNVPARKRFLEMVFKPLLAYHFPNGTINAFPGKDIDSQSLRKFATTYLRKSASNIELAVRQSYFGHTKETTLEGNYEADHSLEELMPCVMRMQTLIEHLQPFPLRLALH